MHNGLIDKHPGAIARCHGVADAVKLAGILARALRKTILRNVADDAAAMEFLVNRSGLDRTIVRPSLRTQPRQAACSSSR